jgi:hypothetical protein
MIIYFSERVIVAKKTQKSAKQETSFVTIKPNICKKIKRGALIEE